MTTDVHRHFIPRSFFEYVCGNAVFDVQCTRVESDDVDVTVKGVLFRLNTTFFEPGRQLANMAKHGIDRSVLSMATPLIDYHVEGVAAAESARIFNDSLAEVVSASDGRLKGWAFLPMQEADYAAEELRRCVRDHGFVGGHIASNVCGRYLNHTSFEPVCRAACELDVPLFVHPAEPGGTERMRDYELTVVGGYLFDNTINLLTLVCSGFLDRWPYLKLVFTHTGAFGLLLRGRMQREIDTNPQLAATLRRPVGDYMRQLYFDTVCFEPGILRYAADLVGAHHLLLGSDAPFPLGEPLPVEFVQRSLPADTAAVVLHESFERLMGK